MSQQYDMQSGFDISSLLSVSKAQLMQMVNQIAPLANIGGVIVMSGAANAHPDVTNNPRFTRYIWLDTQTVAGVLIKVYQGVGGSDTYADWTTITIADDSITAAKIAQYAVSIRDLSGDPKIAYNQDASADNTKSNWYLRLDASGTYVEVASFAANVQATSIFPSKITNGGSANNGDVLMWNTSAGYATWQAISISGLISAYSLTYDRLAKGTLGYILRADPITGDITAASNDDSSSGLFPARTIGLIKLALGGAVANDVVRCDGAQWVKHTPFCASISVLAVASTVSAAHGLTAIPRILNGYAKNVSGGVRNGYAANDIVSLQSIVKNATEFQAVAISADAANVTVSFNPGGTGTGYMIIPKAGGTAAAIATLADWQVWIYASL